MIPFLDLDINGKSSLSIWDPKIIAALFISVVVVVAVAIVVTMIIKKKK